MNKSNEIIQITSSVLERVSQFHPPKAFAEAMERVIELVLGPGECRQHRLSRACYAPVAEYGGRAYGTADLRCLSAVPA